MSDTARTYPTTWLGQPALALETPTLRFVTVPGMGAKIVSLFDKQAAREWLLPPINRRFVPADYGAVFVEQDMSGWDEMFPTIDACHYPVEGSFEKKLLPDHGEVWAIPWQVDSMTSGQISLSTLGRALPYRLTRTAAVLSDQQVRLAFEVVNTGSEPLIALWAAHPQFAVDEATIIRLPSSVKQVFNVHPKEDWADVNGICAWPEAESQHGRRQRLDRVGAASLHQCRKFYLLPDQRVNWAALQQGSHGDWIRLSWNSDQVPFLGIWVDEGTYNAAPTAALEPATGFYDRLDVAWQNHHVMHLPPHEVVRWHLDIEIGRGTLASLE